jgi:hypothetical protein
LHRSSLSLNERLRLPSQVTERRALHAALSNAPLSNNETQAFHHPGVVLWCLITHTDGHLLGVLLLGMRGDLDPNYTEDIRELQRLLAAASLALVNSAAYTQRREAEATIRQLYQHLQIGFCPMEYEQFVRNRLLVGSIS